jgi:integrase/recombinase XerD
VKRGPGGYIVAGTPIQWPPHQRINVDWLNDNEPDLLREIADTPLEQLLIHLELDLGLRRIECKRLRTQDIKQGYLNILGKGRMGGKWRTIPMHPRTPVILQMYIEHRNQLIQKAREKKGLSVTVPDNLIIHERAGELRTYGDTSIDKRIKRVEQRLKNIGHTSIHFSNHTLRRTFGRTMWKANVPLETIARIMGHESTETTIQYLGIQMMDMQQAMQTVYQYTTQKTQKKTIMDQEIKVHL